MKSEVNRRFNILIVDDNPENLKVLGNILRGADYIIGFASDGRQALSILRQTDNYDLVLLDIEMPILNGIETCKEMHQNSKLKEIPVIFLTAYNDPDSIVNGFDAGAQDYVTKPFNSKELLARISTHLQLKQKTQEVKEYAEELKKINATKDKFMSIIAHDLRNPFDGLERVSEMLLKNLKIYDSQKTESLVKSILNASKQGSALLENLLEWSKSQTGKIAFKPIKLKLYEVVEKCIKNITATANNKNIKLINNISKQVMLVADEYMLETIIRNLITNAVKYTPDSGVVTMCSINNDDNTQILVTDTGIGISDEISKKLFKLDKNCSMPGTANEKGTGLGLILCKEFVEYHGGDIWVEKANKVGSIFNFTISKEIKEK